MNNKNILRQKLKGEGDMGKLTKPKRDRRTPLQKEIESVLANMATMDPASAEYGTYADHLKVLYEAKATEKSKRPSTDVIISTAGSLIGILMIIKHEQLNVISTKALQFVTRGKG